MELKDLLLTPIYLIIIYSIAYSIKVKYKDKQLEKYFIAGLNLKIIGGIFFGLIYHFYYTGGDTINYFNSSKHLYLALTKDPLLGLKILFTSAGDIQSNTFVYTSKMWGFHSEANFFVVKVISLLGLLCFHTYTVVTLFFAVLSFSGLWKMYLTFLKIFPHLKKELAIAIFFIPSVFFWGSGIMKDTLCIGAIGWLFFGFYHLLIKKNNYTSSVLFIIVSVFILKEVKTYIILCFLPAALLWVFLENSAQIKSAALKILAKPILLMLAIPIAYYGANKISEDSDKYSFDNIAKTASITSNYLERQTLAKAIGVRTGSSYSVGKLDGSLQSMIISIPQAINVTLFRPYLFEVRNPVMLLSALESTWLLLFTIYIFMKIGIFKSFSKIMSTPILSFCFIFSIMFSIGVGLTAGNFGTLVRYKTPLIPFYVAGLFILRSLHVSKKRVKQKSYYQKFSNISSQ